MITNFYTSLDNISDETLKIKGEEARHILTVLRHKTGDVIAVVDGCGTKYNVSIERTSKNSLQGKIISKIRKENEPLCYFTLAQAVCRQERMDFLIEKATEIGVCSIIPILTERSLIKVSGASKGKNKIDRWRRIAIASMKQSLRTVLPKIEDITPFNQLFSDIRYYNLCLIACMEEGSKKINELEELKRKLRNVLLIVGPEAGFTDDELSQAIASGAIPITLGERRLRTETAGVVFLSLVLHQLGDLG